MVSKKKSPPPLLLCRGVGRLLRRRPRVVGLHRRMLPARLFLPRFFRFHKHSCLPLFKRGEGRIFGKSEKTRKQILVFLGGTTHSEESLAKMSGRTHTPETRAKISASFWETGKTLSDETRARMSKVIS